MQVVAVEIGYIKAGYVREDQLHQADMVGKRLAALRIAP